MGKERIAKTIAELQVDIEMLTNEIEAHRLVIGWLIAHTPDNGGMRFLRNQANIIDPDGQGENIVANELDSLRSLAASLVVDDGNH